MAFIYICGIVVIGCIIADVWLRIQEKKPDMQ